MVFLFLYILDLVSSGLEVASKFMENHSDVLTSDWTPGSPVPFYHKHNLGLGQGPTWSVSLRLVLGFSEKFSDMMSFYFSKSLLVSTLALDWSSYFEITLATLKIS